MNWLFGPKHPIVVIDRYTSKAEIASSKQKTCTPLSITNSYYLKKKKTVLTYSIMDFSCRFSHPALHRTWSVYSIGRMNLTVVSVLLFSIFGDVFSNHDCVFLISEQFVIIYMILYNYYLTDTSIFLSCGIALYTFVFHYFL